MHCLPFTAKRRVLIGARQTEDHWKPPDRESVGAKAQDKVSMRPEEQANQAFGHTLTQSSLGGKGHTATWLQYQHLHPWLHKKASVARTGVEQNTGQEDGEEEACKQGNCRAVLL